MAKIKITLGRTGNTHRVRITLEGMDGSAHRLEPAPQDEAMGRMVEYIGRRWGINDEERAELQVVIDAVVITGTPLEYDGLAPIYVKVEKA